MTGSGFGDIAKPRLCRSQPLRYRLANRAGPESGQARMPARPRWRPRTAHIWRRPATTGVSPIHDCCSLPAGRTQRSVPSCHRNRRISPYPPAAGRKRRSPLPGQWIVCGTAGSHLGLAQMAVGRISNEACEQNKHTQRFIMPRDKLSGGQDPKP